MAAMAKTITVNGDGNADFSTVQQAVDSTTSSGFESSEQVVVPKEKTHVVLEGEDASSTIIEFGALGTSDAEDATFAVFGEFFVARHIAFKWTTAAFVGADKVGFFHYSFYGEMDTLNDRSGRHYFSECHIEGLVDFIWGAGTSIYDKCDIVIKESISLGTEGYITAQARESATETTGFVFKDCTILADGPRGHLGRAYRPYSRVLFYRNDMKAEIAPEGWEIWDQEGHEATIEFSEVECFGQGAKNMTHRVEWEKKLSPEEIDQLTDPKKFIDQDGWLDTLPA